MGRPASRRDEDVYKEAEAEAEEGEEDGVGGVEAGVEVSPSLCVQCMQPLEKRETARLCIWGDGANHLG